MCVCVAIAYFANFNGNITLSLLLVINLQNCIVKNKLDIKKLNYNLGIDDKIPPYFKPGAIQKPGRTYGIHPYWGSMTRSRMSPPNLERCKREEG